MRLIQLKEAQYAYRAEPFIFANKQKFVPDALISPDTEQAETILGRVQLPKVNKLADILGIEWNAMYVKRFMQSKAYNTKQGRMVWSYILVGTDEDGNEIAYYKYEGGTGGSGQSYVYSNKRNKTKLSILLKSTTEEAKKMLQGRTKDVYKARRIAKKRVTEAKYSEQPQEMYFMVEDTGEGVKLVGPFATSEQANKFRGHMEKRFSEFTVAGPTEVVGIQSPDQYTAELQGHLDWFTSD